MTRLGVGSLWDREGMLAMHQRDLWIGCVFAITLCAEVCAEVVVDFDAQIAPILARRCLECHFGDAAEAKLDLSNHKAMLNGGESGEALRPGDPQQSLIWRRIVKDEMPEGSPLPADEKELIATWIRQGAQWGETDIDPFRISTDRRAGWDWWAWQPLQNSLLPDVDDARWIANPIDAFVLAQLKQRGLKPSPRAVPSTLARRLYFDVTGLPPATEVVQRLKQADGDWYERLVDRVLASPHYGQRWARHWLDVVRFGESHGFEYNQPRNEAWHYRNWVIDSLNRDLPYDDFVRWQVAGDVLHPNTYEGLAATGFLVAGPHNTTKPSNDRMRKVMRHDELEDIVGTIGQTFLGLTINCARCHDHKFDPISQQEYYQFVATVIGIDHGQRDIPGDKAERASAARRQQADLKQQLDKLRTEQNQLFTKVREQSACETTEAQKPPSQAQLAKHLSAAELARSVSLRDQIDRFQEQHKQLEAVRADRIYAPVSRSPEKVNRLRRGDVTTPAEPALPAGIRAVNGELADFQLSDSSSDADRREKLARWLTHEGNALFARVIVNRLWHYHFGQGLVRTPSDFGFNGDRPSHPRLLDFLAGELIRADWQLKPLHRMILLSNTYRQASHRRQQAETVDAGNRLLWRMSPRRLSAEEIRDAILSVAGQLDDRHGGPGYRDVREYKYRGSHFYDPIEPKDGDAVRRTVYRFSPRGAKRTILDTFDCPDPSAKTPARAVTITPLQALSLMNHYFVMDMSQLCAGHLENRTPSLAAAIGNLYERAYGRIPTETELHRATSFAKQNSLSDLCRVIFNSNEFLHVR